MHNVEHEVNKSSIMDRVALTCYARCMSEQITEHFRWTEFASRDRPVPLDLRLSVERVCNELEILRAELDAPITVISGWRSQEHNDSVGGKSKSQHLVGTAADIRVSGVTPAKVHETIERLITQGVMLEGGLGLYDSFCHYDVRGRRARWYG